jgi:uncharacterized membrane protein
MKTLLLWAFVGLPLLLLTVISLAISIMIATSTMAMGWLSLTGINWIIFGGSFILICLDIVFVVVLMQLKAASTLESPGEQLPTGEIPR